MSDIDKPLPDSDVTLNLRAIMSGKEVGSIIGRGGETVNSIREESGANIYISDSSVPERVVAVKGPTDSVYKAYTRICKKLEENEEKARESRDRSRSDDGKITLRLVVPASQCGSLIGRGGTRIKEIREETGANVQVASDQLPGSTERAVTVTGTREAVNQTVYHICCVMLESPAKDGNIQYQPGRGGFGGAVPFFGGGGRGEGRGGPPNPLAGLLGLGGGTSTLAALATFAEAQSGRRSRDDDRESSFQMSVPNHLIGSVIGNRGTKIAEIRNMSGAMIKISRSDESESSSSTERQIEITGNPNSVALAKSLINLTLDKASIENERDDDDRRRDRGRDDDRRDRYRDRDGPDMNLAGLLANPDVMKAVSTLAQLGGMGMGMGMGGYGQMGGGMNRGRSSYGGSGRSRDDDRRDSKRSKFAPY